MFLRYKPNQYSKAFNVLLLALDAFVAFVVFSQAVNILSYTFIFDTSDLYTFGLAWLLLWIIISIFSNGYEVDQHRRLMRTVRITFKIAFLHLPFAGGVAYLIGLKELTFADLASLYGLQISLILLIKSVLLLVYRFVRNLEKNKNKAVIVGYTPTGINLYKHFLSDKSSGYTFAGFFDDEQNNPLVLGDLRKLKKHCIRENINEIFFALPYDKELIRDISSFADDNFIRFAMLQDIGSKELSTVSSVVYDNDLPVITLKSSRRVRSRQEKPHQRALSVIKNLNL